MKGHVKAVLVSAIIAAVFVQQRAHGQTAETSPFRVLVPGAGIIGCDVRGDAAAYRSHLEKRLNRPVSLCGVKSSTAAAAALGAGKAEMVLLDPIGFAAVEDRGRAILAGRVSAETGRVLTVAVVLKSAGKDTLAKLTGAAPIVAGDKPASKDVPLRALADAGAPVASFRPVLVMNDDNAAFAALRTGRGNLLVLTAGARQRVCLPLDPKSNPCADLVEIWRGRPTAPFAFVVPKNMPIGDRHQLVGIHIALHFEAPAAMAFITRAMPPAVALDPTEAGALLIRQP